MSSQRDFSSNCSAVEPIHRKNAATVFNARCISLDSAWVEVRWMVRLRPLSTILPMMDMYAGREVIASRCAVGSASRQKKKEAPRFLLHLDSSLTQRVKG